MVGKKKKEEKKEPVVVAPPKLANRRANNKSTFKMGRTIAGKRERLETSSERMEARKKGKKKKTLRLVFTILFFVVAFGLVIYVLVMTFGQNKQAILNDDTGVTDVKYEPTIEVVDMDAAATGGVLTSRMKDFIGQAEVDFRELGYNPIKAVIPSGAIREVDFYFEGRDGYVKTTIDRGTGVTAEDMDRMIRYLTEKGIGDFEYIDVRVEGRGFWK